MLDRPITSTDLIRYRNRVGKPCHGDCIEGWYHVAYTQHYNGHWDVFRFPCRCTYPAGLDLNQLTQDHRYNRRPDYTGPIPGQAYIHPRNNSRFLAGIKQTLAGLQSKWDLEMADEVLF